MTPANLLAEWSRLLIGTLAHAGIRDVVVSPGSRSTPLVCALSELPALRMHVVIDERSAGFFALGQARATGNPSLCVCTSGSAVANYYPAVIEAAESRVPLVIVSADRPFELSDARAPQTIDQTKLFGGAVRAFVELGNPDDHPDALAGLQRRAMQAVVRARWPEPGAVHLNFRARKPLEPCPSDGADGAALTRRVSELLERQPARIETPPFALDAGAVSRLAERLAAAHRPVIACGPMPMLDVELGRAIAELCVRAGAVLLAESASQVRHGAAAEIAGESRCDGFDALIDLPLAERLLEPDLIVQFGRPLVSAAWERFVRARPAVERWLIADTPAADPLVPVREILVGDARRLAEGLGRELAERRAGEALAAERRSWRRRIAEADRVVWDAVAQVSDEAPLTEARATRSVVASVGSGEILALGNSLPIRDADWFCRGSNTGFRVWSQRGTNGIDGVVSGAAGAAAMSNSCTTLLVGDIALLHDVGGLWAARQLTSPFVIAVIDNGGGRIFEQLPLAERPDFPPERLERWTTPHGLDLSHAARLYGIESFIAATAESLDVALRAARAHAGPSLVVAKVEPSSARRQRRRIAELVSAVVAARIVVQ